MTNTINNIMRNLSGIIFVISVFILAFVMQGCENTTESITPNFTLYGRVLGLYNSPQYGIKVKAGDKETETGMSGYFRIMHLVYPYKLTVLDTINRKCIMVPETGSDLNNELRIYNIPAARFELTNTVVNVVYPSGTVTSGGKIIITDSYNDFYCCDAGETGGSIGFGMIPGSSKYLNVLILLYTIDSANRIIDYTKYYSEGSFLVEPGNNKIVNVQLQNFKDITDKSHYHINFNPSSGNTIDKRYFYIYPYSRRPVFMNESCYLETFNSNSVDIIAPAMENLYLKKIAGFITHDASGLSSTSEASVDGNTSINDTYAPVLVSPAPGSNVDLNSEIVFNQGLSGVNNKFYKLILSDTTSQVRAEFEIYIQKERFSISDLNNIGLGSIKGRTFVWRVEAYDKITISEFLYDNNYNFSFSKSESMSRSFTVSP